MKQLKVFALTLACVVSLAASLTTATVRKRGVPSCCNMKRCCYENKRCCKNANHACCTGKHHAEGCCCKKDSCPMPARG